MLNSAAGAPRRSLRDYQPTSSVITTRTHGTPSARLAKERKAEEKTAIAPEHIQPRKTLDPKPCPQQIHPYPIASVPRNFWTTTVGSQTQTPARCFHDWHIFEWTPVSLPMEYNCERERYSVWGIFCSLGCVKAYAQSQRWVMEWRIMELLTNMAADVYGFVDEIVAAPAREALAFFCGVRGFSIGTFRQSATTQKAHEHLAEAPPFDWLGLSVCKTIYEPALITQPLSVPLTEGLGWSSFIGLAQSSDIYPCVPPYLPQWWISKVEDLPETTDLPCLYHGFTFKHRPFALPDKYDDERDRFHVVGTFCSIGCLKKYVLEQRWVMEWRAIELINDMLYRLYHEEELILPSPDYELLSIFCGAGGLQDSDFGVDGEHIELLFPPTVWMAMHEMLPYDDQQNGETVPVGYSLPKNIMHLSQETTHSFLHETKRQQKWYLRS